MAYARKDAFEVRATRRGYGTLRDVLRSGGRWHRFARLRRLRGVSQRFDNRFRDATEKNARVLDGAINHRDQFPTVRAAHRKRQFIVFQALREKLHAIRAAQRDFIAALQNVLQSFCDTHTDHFLCD
jgi:hypothetical protein